MKEQKKLIWGIVLNLLIFVLVTFSTVSMMTGFNFMSKTFAFSATSWKAFIYFTVDSNVYAGIISLIFAIFQLMVLNKKIKSVPKAVYLLKFSASVSLTLTMMTTVFFLAPTSSSGFFALFMNSNFFYHFFVPVLCFISYVWFENDCQFTLPFTFTGIIPMGLYSIFYISTILIHLENGVVAKGTDWYGFLFMGFNTIYIVIPLILGITYLFAFGTWAISKKVASKQK